jgi:hypothetical protein
MIKGYDENCALCRLMRSLAFSGIGAALGAGIAYLMGASKQNILMAAIVTAAILVFGIMNKKKKK